MSRLIMHKWFIGIDLGTSGCKTIVIDSQVRVLGFGASTYSDLCDQWDVGWQDPDILLKAVYQSVRSAVQNAQLEPKHCEGICVGGAFHSLIAVERDGRPLTWTFTWASKQAEGQVKELLLEVGGQQIYQQTGCPAHSLYPLYKIRFLRDEQPDIFSRASHFISAKEYILLHLTGAYGVDYAIASGAGLLNIHSLDWSELALDFCRLQPERLAPLKEPQEVLGKLMDAPAKEMGLPSGIPITLGSADAVNSSLGAGAVGAAVGTCMVGTSGAIRIISPSPKLDHNHRTWCYGIDPEHWLTGGAINNGGLALAWFMDLIRREHASQGASKMTVSEMMELARQVGPGSSGLICLPFLSGERSPNWNMDARGVFFGLSTSHHAGHMARSILEGVTFRLRSIQDAMQDIGLGYDRLRVSGGITHSDLWMQILAGSLNRDLQVLEWGETSCLGAALWNLFSAGIITHFEEIPSYIHVKETIHPVIEEVSLYSRLYNLYLEIYNRLGDLYTEISALQSELIPPTVRQPAP
jgi:gluconokinase